MTDVDTKIELRVDKHDRLDLYQKLIYPVFSRRSGGLSLGINLNPDKKCTFRCVYCQVDRRSTTNLKVSHSQILAELRSWLTQMKAENWSFQGKPLKDIAIAGDGEPTTVDFLPSLISEIIELKKSYGLNNCKLILFTNGTNTAREDLLSILPDFSTNGGEIWFKLDAWNESLFKQINRTRFTFRQVIENLIHVGTSYPITIQSCFFNWDEEIFELDKYEGYIQMIRDLLEKGVKIKRLQLYTLARAPEDDRALPWDNDKMTQLSNFLKKQLNIPIEVYFST